MHQFHICTIANNLAQYAQMKQTFVAAGFDEESCRYTLLDNSSGNVHEPYQSYNAILAQATEPYVLFCHQDLLLNRRHGRDHLLSVLADLNVRDPLWAVAGNAGADDSLNLIRHITDPSGTFRAKALPCLVHALDENFLVVRSDAGLRFSPGLHGFHLYAADLCLNAHQAGHTCYVVDFLVTHLSSGNNQSAEFRCSVQEFQYLWNPFFRVYYLRTPCTCFFVSRYPLLRSVLGSKRLVQSMDRRGRLHVLMLWLQRKSGDLKTLWESQLVRRQSAAETDEDSNHDPARFSIP